MKYEEFLQSKLITNMPSGFEPFALPDRLYPYQTDLVDWACRRGKSALFTMTGTGKTMMQAAWSDAVCGCDGRVLILAPLAVAKQTVREAAKIGIQITYCRDASEVKPHGIHITNYEILHHFDGVKWDGIVLDESSILKSFSGKIRNQIIEYSRFIPYKLACTATPAPNDYMELGNHAEFLGIMSFTEMLATFFVHDGGETSKWRLKGHAEDKFFEWMASWGVFLTKPSDLGYSNEGFELPPLNTYQHIVASDAPEGALFAFEVKGLQERQGARRESLNARANKCAEIVFSSLIGKFCAKMAEKTGVANNGLESKICGKQEEKRARKPGIQTEAKRTGTSQRCGETERVYEGICNNKTRKIQENSRAAGCFQCEEKSEICTGCRVSGETKSQGEGISGEQSAHAENSKDKEVQYQSGTVQCFDGATEPQMCNMWVQRHIKEKLLPCSGSLSCHGGCPRVALHELQYGIGDVQRLARTIIESGRIFKEQWVLWCDLNSEQELLSKIFGTLCVSIYGSQTSDKKEELLDSWLNEEVPILISKPSIIGFGLNLQQCHNTAFVGLSDSFEAIFQATKRFHRHGQKHAVNRHLIISEAEGAVLQNVQRKEREFESMIENMVQHTKSITMKNIKQLHSEKIAYNADKTLIIPEWMEAI